MVYSTSPRKLSRSSDPQITGICGLQLCFMTFLFVGVRIFNKSGLRYSTIVKLVTSDIVK